MPRDAQSLMTHGLALQALESLRPPKQLQEAVGAALGEAAWGLPIRSACAIWEPAEHCARLSRSLSHQSSRWGERDLGEPQRKHGPVFPDVRRKSSRTSRTSSGP